MREVAGRDHADALAACPGGEMFEVEIAACRARIFRVDVQIRVEAHASHAFCAADTLRQKPGEKPARRYKGAIRSKAESAPCGHSGTVAPACTVDIRAQWRLHAR